MNFVWTNLCSSLTVYNGQIPSRSEVMKHNTKGSNGAACSRDLCMGLVQPVGEQLNGCMAN